MLEGDGQTLNLSLHQKRGKRYNEPKYRIKLSPVGITHTTAQRHKNPSTYQDQFHEFCVKDQDLIQQNQVM